VAGGSVHLGPFDRRAEIMVGSGRIRLEGDGEGEPLTIIISEPAPGRKLPTLSIRHGDEKPPVVIGRLFGHSEAESLLEGLARLIRAVHRAGHLSPKELR
jgi:hypothetical protein